MNPQLPAAKAYDALTSAEDGWDEYRDAEQARVDLANALSWQDTVESFRSPRGASRLGNCLTLDELENHELFTTVLKRACKLAWDIGDKELAQSLCQRALAWADDPNTGGNRRQFWEVLALWRRLTNPWWKRPFVVIYDFLVLAQEYGVHHQDVDT